MLVGMSAPIRKPGDPTAAPIPAEAPRALERPSAAILMILGARGIQASEEARGRILSETDLSVLERWLQRAATATAVEELFLESAGR
ncbi:hypothetical protein [Sorangium sp. So ce394]|uniref:hypothetical protein n=1 Tax=Sorangium sp. So ce394 TaxID=3133310 RepID=UPI003F5B71B4